MPDPPPPSDQEILFCDRCSVQLTPGMGGFYVVKIEAVADPAPPHFRPEDLALDVHREIERLVAQMHDMSPQELKDQVYRRVVLYLCDRCYPAWIENPTG